jgi:hypothetical protein
MKKSKFWDFFLEFGKYGQFHPQISVLYVQTGRYLFKSEIVLIVSSCATLCAVVPGLVALTLGPAFLLDQTGQSSAHQPATCPDALVPGQVNLGLVSANVGHTGQNSAVCQPATTDPVQLRPGSVIP